MLGGHNTQWMGSRLSTCRLRNAYAPAHAHSASYQCGLPGPGRGSPEGEGAARWVITHSGWVLDSRPDALRARTRVRVPGAGEKTGN